MPVLAPTAAPERPAPAPTGSLPGVFRRRLEAEWTAAMPPLLRRGRFLVFLHAIAAHADTYGVLRPYPGLDLPASLARGACTRPDTAERLLRAALAAGLLAQRAPGRFTLASPYAPDWTAAAAVLAAPSSSRLEA